MNRRTLLSLTVGGLAAIGLAISAIPFIQSMSVTAARENAAWATCDVSDLPQGKARVCGYAMVYRRTEKDKTSVSKFIHLLSDPESLHSEQPETAKNIWRSENSEFFVFYPWAPVRRCVVELISSGPMNGWEVPETEALSELPYFRELCEGRAWDTSGRLYFREDYPLEHNLIVPKVRWVDASKLLVYGM